MITMMTYKNNLFAIMRLMMSNNGAYTDVIYKGRLYRVTVEDLNTNVVARRRPRKRSLIAQVDTAKCPTCKKIVINGVCMNSVCPVNAGTLAR